MTKLVKTELAAEMVKDVPLGRAGTTKEIGDAAVFLASRGASYVTGHTLTVDGGDWLFRPPTAPRNEVAKYSREIEAKSRGVGTAKM